MRTKTKIGFHPVKAEGPKQQFGIYEAVDETPIALVFSTGYTSAQRQSVRNEERARLKRELGAEYARRFWFGKPVLGKRTGGVLVWTPIAALALLWLRIRMRFSSFHGRVDVRSVVMALHQVGLPPYWDFFIALAAVVAAASALSVNRSEISQRVKSREALYKRVEAIVHSDWHFVAGQTSLSGMGADGRVYDGSLSTFHREGHYHPGVIRFDKFGNPLWKDVTASALARTELPHALARHKKQFAEGLIAHMSTDWPLPGLKTWALYWEREGTVGYLVPLLEEVLPDSLPITDDDLRGWD
ncbi:MAG: hypothetical protein ACYCVB_03535 [Bacilli bacterium]